MSEKIEKELEIYCVTRDFIGSVANLFSKHGEVKLLPDDYSKISADLIIFTGGEDINPKLYRQKAPANHYYNNTRDFKELSVLNAVMSGQLKANKVFGICRGLQLINVGLGGTLVYDIETHYGNPHHMYHKLYHMTKNPFSFLETVNSMHHQCIKYIGKSLRQTIMAVNPVDSVVEMVHWQNKYFATQFHPEFFPDDLSEKHKFADTLIKWVTGKVSMGTEEERISSRKNMWTVSPEFEARERAVDFNSLEAAFGRTGNATANFVATYSTMINSEESEEE